MRDPIDTPASAVISVNQESSRMSCQDTVARTSASTDWVPVASPTKYHSPEIRTREDVSALPEASQERRVAPSRRTCPT